MMVGFVVPDNYVASGDLWKTHPIIWPVQCDLDWDFSLDIDEDAMSPHQESST